MTKTRTLVEACAAFLLGTFAFGSTAADGIPAVPAVPVEQLPDALRARVAGALQRAHGQPRDASAVGELAMLLHAYDQTGAAEQAYERARALDPARFDWAYLLGLVRLRSGRVPEAVRALRTAVEMERSSVPGRVRLGEALLAAGKPDESAEVFRGLLRGHPDLPQAHYGLGRALAALGDLPRAVESYEAATRRYPAYGAAHYALGLAYRDLGRPDEARERLASYQSHALEAPPLPDPAYQRVLALGDRTKDALEEGVRLSRAGDVPGAIREHLRALDADPQLARAHANLIGLYARLGRLEKVEEHYRAASALDASAVEVHYNYGAALAEAGRRAEAIAALERVLALSPSHARAHDRLGMLREAEGKLDEAARHYREAVANESGYREGRFNLGRVLLAQGRPAEAASQFEAILEPDDEQTPRYQFALGAAYARAGQRDKALAQLAEARRRAEAAGQDALAASIARDEARLRVSSPR